MKPQLLVEGKNDVHVFGHIFLKHNIFPEDNLSPPFTLEGKDGDKIYKIIPIQLKTDIDTLGIVVDADTNLAGKWQKLTSMLENAGYSNLPAQPEPAGTIIEAQGKLPRLGIWLMPDNQTHGMLEDFVRMLIPPNDVLLPHVETALESIESAGANHYKLIHKSKAKIHTWLAWQETPGTPMGLAIKKTYLDTQQELCLRFAAWVNRLFNP